MAEESNPKLKRFTAMPFEDNAGNEFAANMEEMLDGEWVRYVDMQAEIERLRALLREWLKGCPNPPDWHWSFDLHARIAHALAGTVAPEGSPVETTLKLTEAARLAATRTYLEGFERTELASPREAFQAGWDAAARQPRSSVETTEVPHIMAALDRVEADPVLDHRFTPDRMDPDICVKCSSTKASHRDAPKAAGEQA